MELLAPAGSMEALEAAVRAGADAVYFGAASFNARRNAKNFSDDDIAFVVSYCHVRGVRAYLALNTLISDAEMQDALSLAGRAAAAGIDGVILQDLGLAKRLRQAAPALPLHASTQLTVHNISGIKQLKALGFKRVVLARENTLRELREMADAALDLHMELEIFVQGALCMSMSGQCLFSAVLGGRSGNRGLCAGPCRLPFSVKGGNGHDLSLKDLNLYAHFETLKALSITSLKIEGRMKRPEYVAMAVDCARYALDHGHVSTEKMDALQRVFSRSGFTDGYFTGNIDRNMFGVRSEEDMTATKQILSDMHALYRRERSSVPVDMHFTALENTPATLWASDGNNKVCVTGEIPQKAISVPLSYEWLHSKLQKCGGTPYRLNHLSIDIEETLTLPSAAVNTLKTDALQQLTIRRGQPAPIPFQDVLPASRPRRTPCPSKTYISVHTLEQIPDRKDCIDLIFVPLFSDFHAVQSYIDAGYPIAVKTPPSFFGCDEKIRERLQAFKNIGVKTALCENIGAVDLILSCGLALIGGTGMNCYNSDTAEALPFSEIILSAECAKQQIDEISAPVPTGIFAYGRLPLMLLRNCPIKSQSGCKNCDHTITDRKQIAFRIFCEDNAVRLYNSRPVYLADRPHILNACDFLFLQFTDETKAKVSAVIDSYRRHLPSKEPFTRGMLEKGVL